MTEISVFKQGITTDWMILFRLPNLPITFRNSLVKFYIHSVNLVQLSIVTFSNCVKLEANKL